MPVLGIIQLYLYITGILISIKIYLCDYLTSPVIIEHFPPLFGMKNLSAVPTGCFTYCLGCHAFAVL